MTGMTTTLAVLAWHPSNEADPNANLERYTGTIGRRPGVAYFPGAADALRAAAHWQRRDPQTHRAIAVTVAELDPTDPDGSETVAMTRRLAEISHPGTILATEIVRLLIPHPDCGTWATATQTEPATTPIPSTGLARSHPHRSASSSPRTPRSSEPAS
jgi:hypothetical protein